VNFIQQKTCTFLAVLLCCGLVVQAEDWVRVTRNTDINVGAEAVGKAMKGDKFIKIEERGAWVGIRFEKDGKQTSGWVPKSAVMDAAEGTANKSGDTSKPKPPDIHIYKAAEAGNLEAVKQHIAAGTDLNQRQPEGDDKKTPLMTAAGLGRTEIAKALIEGGAKLDIQDKDGGTALSAAAFMCHPEIVQALLKKGADKNIKKNDGSTALQSVEIPFKDVKWIYELVDGLFFKPAGMPLDYGRIEATRPKVAKLLGGGGGNAAKPASRDVDIFKAVGEGDLKALKRHIAAGTDLNQRSPDGDDKKNPLMVAAVLGRTEIAKALIEGGAKLDLKDKDGGTALSAAAFFCHTEIVQALLKKGADKNIKNKDGNTALQSVEGPFKDVKWIYELVDGLFFKPNGMPLDYERIKATRPKIAKMLR